MVADSSGTRVPPDPLIARGRRDIRIGQTLLIAGLAILVVCIALGNLSQSSGQGSVGFLTDVVGSGGFALMLAGAVFFHEGRAFLRRNKPSA
jgi:peptidoglycan/LPS O-acetylase OafA/YrhL